MSGGSAGRLLAAEPPLWLALVLGTLAGLLACGYFAGYGALLESARLAAPPGDPAQAASGAVAFMRDGWRFPLFEVEGWVEGRRVNVLFTDSIPVFLLIWKALGLGPEAAAQFYLAAWTVVAFAFQGFAGALSLRLLGVRNGLALFAAALMLASLPFFIFRFGHFALATHGVILIGLALALLRFPVDARGAVLRLAAWAGLLALSLLLHPYLLAMVAGLWLLSLLTLLALARDDGLPLPPVALGGGVAATLALLLAIMLVSGHLSGGGSNAPGFGRFSANLATFFMPAGSSAFFPTEAIWLPGQYEGYAYLPLAVLLAIGAAGFMLVRYPLPEPLTTTTVLSTRRGLILLGIAALFIALFATGGRFAWFQEELFRVEYPQPIHSLGEVFRSSGRFIWLIPYGLFLISIAVLVLRSRGAAGPIGLTAAAALTLIELTPMRGDLPKEPGLYSGDPGLRAIAESVERFTLHPVKPCGDYRAHADGELQFLSARYGLTLANSFYSAREEVDCNAPDATALPKGLQADTAIIVLTPVFAADLDAAGLPLDACRRREGLTICLEDWTAHPTLMAEFPSLAVDRLSVPSTLSMTKEENADRWLGEGFSGPEPWGVWSVGTRSTVLLPLAEEARMPGAVTLRAGAFTYPGVGDVPITVTLEARTAPDALWQPQDTLQAVWRDGEGPRDVTLENALEKVEALRLVIEPARPMSPKEAGIGTDARPLGMSLTELRIAPGEGPPAE
ncbi:MAG: hypothetical protein AAFU72_09345 [Pseudomonadota bacterium]